MLIHAERLFDGVDFLHNALVRIEQGRIAELTPDVSSGKVDFSCPVLSPGFIDLHIHGCLGRDTMNGENDVRAMARTLLRFGVTAFAPTTMAAGIADTRLAIQGVAGAARHNDGAAILGCHMEGPFLSAEHKGAQPERFLCNPSMDAYAQMTKESEHAVCMMTLAPELVGADEVIAALKDRIVLSAGHTGASYDQMLRAARLGVTQATHLFNGMNALGHRLPGSPGACLVLDSIRIQLIADLIHVHPALLTLAWRSKPSDGCILITDAMEAAGMPDGDYLLGGQHVSVQNGAARLSDGTLAGSTLTMDRAVRNMAGPVGAGLANALRMATRNPADALGRKDIGRIVVGARADLVALDSSLHVLRTYVNGEAAYCV